MLGLVDLLFIWLPHCSLNNTKFMLFSATLHKKTLFSSVLNSRGCLYSTSLLCQCCKECWLDTSTWLNIILEFKSCLRSVSETQCGGYCTKYTLIKHEADKCAATLRRSHLKRVQHSHTSLPNPLLERPEAERKGTWGELLECRLKNPHRAVE